MIAINTPAKALALGVAAGALPVAAAHGSIFYNDFRSGHQGQPKTIPTAIATMVIATAGLTGLGAAVKSHGAATNATATKAASMLQGAGIGFALAGGAAVLGYLLLDSLPHKHG